MVGGANAPLENANPQKAAKNICGRNVGFGLLAPCPAAADDTTTETAGMR